MQREKSPARSPQEEIELALQVVDVREEARHKRRSSEQRQRYEALMYQDRTCSSSVVRTRAALPRPEQKRLALLMHTNTRRLGFNGIGDTTSAEAQKTKYLRLWSTRFCGSKRTAVLVAKETAAVGVTDSPQALARGNGRAVSQAGPYMQYARWPAAALGQ